MITDHEHQVALHLRHFLLTCNGPTWCGTTALDDEPSCVMYHRDWPGTYTRDGLFVFAAGSAKAARITTKYHKPYELWARSGPLLFVLEALAELPAPDYRTAPQLAKRLWTPGVRW